MTMLAAHLQWQISIPLAVTAAVWLIWYWLRLGGERVPKRRRRIRRVSLGLMLVTLPVFVAALSFLDPKTHPSGYIITWCAAIVLVGMVFITAGLDVMATMRIEQERCEEDIQRIAIEVAQAARERQADQAREQDETQSEGHDGGAP